MRLGLILSAVVMTMCATVDSARGAGPLEASGKVTFVRVNDVGDTFGHPDPIKVEVVFALDNEPGRAFGFQLRKNNDQVARQGMLDLLIAAFENNWTMTVDYMLPDPTDVIPNPKNGVAIRLLVKK